MRAEMAPCKGADGAPPLGSARPTPEQMTARTTVNSWALRRMANARLVWISCQAGARPRAFSKPHVLRVDTGRPAGRPLYNCKDSRGDGIILSDPCVARRRESRGLAQRRSPTSKARDIPRQSRRILDHWFDGWLGRRPEVCGPPPVEGARVHGRDAPHACALHRREHGDLLDGLRPRPEAAAVSRTQADRGDLQQFPEGRPEPV